MGTSQNATGRRGGTPVWQVLNRLMMGLIVLVSLVIAALAFIPEIKRSHEEKQKIESLKNEIRNEELILDERKRELELLKSNPEYVEVIARDKMDLMKEGEVIFRIDTGERKKSELDTAIISDP